MVSSSVPMYCFPFQQTFSTSSPAKQRERKMCLLYQSMDEIGCAVCPPPALIPRSFIRAVAATSRVNYLVSFLPSPDFASFLPKHTRLFAFLKLPFLLLLFAAAALFR